VATDTPAEATPAAAVTSEAAVTSKAAEEHSPNMVTLEEELLDLLALHRLGRGEFWL
jgi:hypothetical protein